MGMNRRISKRLVKGLSFRVEGKKATPRVLPRNLHIFLSVKPRGSFSIKFQVVHKRLQLRQYRAWHIP